MCMCDRPITTLAKIARLFALAFCANTHTHTNHGRRNEFNHSNYVVRACALPAPAVCCLRHGQTLCAAAVLETCETFPRSRRSHSATTTHSLVLICVHACNMCIYVFVQVQAAFIRKYIHNPAMHTRTHMHTHNLVWIFCSISAVFHARTHAIHMTFNKGTSAGGNEKKTVQAVVRDRQRAADKTKKLRSACDAVVVLRKKTRDVCNLINMRPKRALVPVKHAADLYSSTRTEPGWLWYIGGIL